MQSQWKNSELSSKTTRSQWNEKKRKQEDGEGLTFMMSYLFAITVQIVTFLYLQQYLCYFLQERFLSDEDKK